MPTTRFRKQTSTPVGDSLATSSPQRKTRQGAKLEPKHGKHDNEDSNEEEEEQAEAPRQLYTFDGIQYETYQEMVNAKRKRNQQVLEDLGFADNSSLKLSAAINKAKAAATHRGIQGKRQKIEPIRRRKSTRLSGKQSDLIALDYSSPNWNTDNSVIKVTEGAAGDEEIEEEKPSFFKGRVNDGEELSLEEAIELNGPKWISDDSAELARSFQKEVFKLETLEPRARNKSPKSIDTKIQDLSIDNEEWVAKVTPDRIYSVTCHPSESKMIACAGDKLGYVGLWDVDALKTESNNGVHLFHVHSRPVCCLEWVTSDTMVSASYDGTVRKLNVETGTFQQIFATYDDNSYYAEELGYGLDQGYNYWLQYATTDPRYQGSSPSLFMSTSAGTAMHVDLRASETQGITFNERLSEKKINSLR
jgi:WD40 repeat protein